MKNIVVFFVLPVILFSCDPFRTHLDDDDVYYYNTSGQLSSASVPDDSLSVMTWNIKFGGGRIDFFFDCHGDRVIMDSTEVITHLEDIASFINQTSPHILFVQEIDVDSKRSAFVDQVDWLLENTHFQYAVYAPHWRASFIPSEGLGRMDSGNAVFSVVPLSGAKRIGLPLIDEQNFVVRYFYLRRNLLHVRAHINEKPLHLLNTHLSAYAKDGTKRKQLNIVYDYLDSIDSHKEPFIIGGDFNTLPPGTKKTGDFPDSACEGDFEADDFSEETTWMKLLYNRFNSAIPLEKYQADNTPYFTHTTDKNGFWNRKVDYLFSNIAFGRESSTTYQSIESGGYETMPLSDHCAIKAWVLTP